MTEITGSVGQGGINRPQDVGTVQTLLNKNRPAPLSQLAVDKLIGPATITAIKEFQTRVVKLSMPDGRVDPGGKTWRALAGGTSAPSAGNLSGAAWWHANQAKYPNSQSVDTLEPDFQAKVKAFLAALKTAGVVPSISTTRRNKQRAYLMHYSWLIAHGQKKASQVPPEPGVNINWDHGDDGKSRHAATQMVLLFGMAHIAVLDSLHIEGKAIDMTIQWTGTIKVKDNKSGKLVDVGAPHNGAENTTLHQIGSTYGVHKLLSDAPHWSFNGH